MTRHLGKPRFLCSAQVKTFYDRLGRGLDLQTLFERPAKDVLVGWGAFDAATAVFELGCGTGAFAERLLGEVLPVGAHYVGVDVSSTMVALSHRRLACFRAHAQVRQTDGILRFEDAAGTFDRFVATYVLDLLPPRSIRTALEEAWRLLRPGGLLCLASLTFGKTWPSRVLIRTWEALHRRNPGLVGGCRPIDLRSLLLPMGAAFDLLHREVLSTWSVPSEVLVACRAP